MYFEDLTPEMQEKAKACKTPEDFMALAKEAGQELSAEDLEAIAGGSFWDCKEHAKCPQKYSYLSR